VGCILSVLASIFLAATTSTAQVESAGTALEFDGLDDQATQRYESELQFYPITLTAWVKTSQNNADVAGIMSKYADGSLNGYSVFLFNGEVRALYFRDPNNYVWDGAQGLNGGMIADGGWHHVAFVVGSAGGRLYVDGVLKANRAWTGTPGATTSAELFRVARYNTGTIGYLAAEIDQVTVWNSALSASAVAGVYRFVFSGEESDLRQSWNLNEGASNFLADASVYYNYGVAYGNPTWVTSTAPIGPAPIARTLLPILQSGGNATMRGQHNSRGVEATAFFEYGLTSGYGAATAPTPIGNGTSTATLSEALSGLPANTVYHYRLVVTNEFGRLDGPDVSFNTSTPFSIYQEVSGRSILGLPAWGDYDQDGDLDLLTLGHYNPAQGTFDVVIQGNEGGVFTENTLITNLILATAPTWVDYDNDGDLDVAVISSTLSRMYRNDGNGIFTAVDAGLPTNGGAATWGDYDNDGDLDFYFNEAFGSLAIYQNDIGVFRKIAFELATSDNSKRKGSAWADSDNDGDVDLITTGFEDDGVSRSHLWRNFGGVLSDTKAMIPNTRSSAMVWGDENGDGLLDLLRAGGGVTTVLRNLGSNQFVAAGLSLPAVYNADADWGDYDNDGDIDLLLGGADSDGGTSGFARLYRNNGGALADANAGLPSVPIPGGLAWGDFDGDGGLDFAIATDTTTHIYRTTATTTNTPPDAPASPAITPHGMRTDFAWTAASDAQTPSGRLTYNMRVGTTPGGQEIMPANSDLATGLRRLAGPGNVGYGTTHFLNLPPGTYYWSVQAVDTGYAGGPFSDEASFTVLPPGADEAGPGNALHFDGVDDHVQMANPGLPSANTLPITITAWVKTTQSTGVYPGLVTKYAGSSANGWALTLNAGRLAPWYYKDGSTFVEPGLASASDRFIADGEWHHVAFAVDATSARTYIDGALANTQSWTGGAPGPATTSEPIRLGIYFGGAGKFFAGDLDEVTIWNYALSTAEINALRPAHLSGLETGLIAQWNLNEASGTSVADQTGHGFTGTLLNGVSQVTSTAPICAPLVRTLSGRAYANGVLARALVHPQGSPTMAWFEYGPTTSYGSSTPMFDLGSGISSVALSKFIRGLSPSTLYHFRAVATNQFGRINGQDQTFTTNSFLGSGLALSVPLDFSRVVVADINGNDYLDLVETGFLPSSNQAFTLGWAESKIDVFRHWFQDPGLYRGAIAAGDFNNDGAVDLFFSGLASVDNTGRSFLKQNINSRGNNWTFNDAPTSIPPLVDGAAAWGDFDNDGDLDLAVSGTSGATRLCRVYRNDDGALSTLVADLPGVSDGSLAWGDFDNDGDLDLLVTGTTTGDNAGVSTRLYRNSGGLFLNANAALPDTGFGDAQWCDYDLDGDLDVAITGFSSGPIARIYRNDNGLFTLSGNFQGQYFSQLAWGDFDNDGYPDLLTSGTDDGSDGSAASRLYRNQSGTGSFVDMALGLLAISHGDVAWVDRFKDGRLGPFIAGRSASGIPAGVLRYNLSTPNTQPTVPANLVATPQCDRVAFQWNAASDEETLAAGLSYNMRVGTTPGGSEVMSPHANPGTGARRLIEMGNVQLGTTSWLRLPPGTYYWSVQAVDSAFAGSPFAAEQTFTVVSLITPRTTQVSRPSGNQFFFRFTACPGRSFIVQRSDDLASWTDLGPATETTSGVYEYLDTSAGASPRFYRARQQ